MKIIIADDQEILCESLKIIIEQDNDIEVVGVAKNGIEAIELCEKKSPDLVLMDLRMPVLNGEESTVLIKQKHPKIKVLILTTFDDEESVNQVFKNGADGYILKNIKPFELREAIKSTIRGNNVINNQVCSTLMARIGPIKSNNENNDSNTFGLKDKEIEVISYVVQGKSNKEIGVFMGLSEARIKSILSDIFLKLKIEDRIQLAVFAVKNNLC